MQARLKQTATRFKDLNTGEMFYIEGDISMKIKPIQGITAIDMQGNVLVVRDETLVIRVKPTAIEGETVVFEEQTC